MQKSNDEMTNSEVLFGCLGFIFVCVIFLGGIIWVFNKIDEYNTITCPNQEIIQKTSSVPVNKIGISNFSTGDNNDDDYTYYKVNCNNEDNQIFWIDDKNDLNIDGKYKKNKIFTINIDENNDEITKQIQEENDFLNSIVKE